ncbi:MAG: hypothetical protein D6719_13685 [Candidatus Dadabacteria bacterium]|nr:MAG: hypothetical protein D6719_13685 [Candidatus Dadabacteria bacterium]
MVERPFHLNNLMKKGLIWQASSPTDKVNSAPTLKACFGPSAIDSSLPLKGIPSGTVNLFSYKNVLTSTLLHSLRQELFPVLIPTLLACNFLKNTVQNKLKKRFLVWVGRECWPVPQLIISLLPELDDPLSCCLFINPPKKKLLIRTIDTALHSNETAAVIAAVGRVSFALSRRFTLAAKAGNTLGLLLVTEECNNTPLCAYSRWSIAPIQSEAPQGFKLTLLKLKGPAAPLKSWRIQYEPELRALSINLSADTIDRSNPPGSCAARQAC